MSTGHSPLYRGLASSYLPHHVHRTQPPGSPLCRRLASSYLLHSICDTMVYNSSLFRGLTNLYLSHCICVSLAQLLLSATDFPYSHTDTHLPPPLPLHTQSQNKLSVLMTLIKKSIPYQDSKKYHSTNEAVQLDPSVTQISSIQCKLVWP